jgi:hypothetical protein
LLDLRIDGAKEYTALKKNENFTVSIWLMAEGEVDLDPFWDISGFDMTLNFNATLLKATSIVIDPTDWWSGFYPGGVQVFAKKIDNTLGQARIAFIGLPAMNGSHTPPEGKGILANVTFNVIYESDKYPPPSAPIWLENPLPIALKKLYSEDGVIDLADPVGTDWHELTPAYCTRYNLTVWEDADGDGKLSPDDQINLFNYDVGKWLPYKVYAVPITMNVTINPFDTTDEFVEGSTMFTNTWPPYNYLSSDLTASSYPSWPPVYTNVTLSLTYDATGVASVWVEYPNATVKVLTEGTDWSWLGGNQIELNQPCFGVPKSATFVEGINLTTGWVGAITKGIVDLPDITTGWIHRWTITAVKDRLDLYWGVYDSNDSSVERNYALYLDSHLIESGTLTWEGTEIDMYTLINDIDAGAHNLTLTIDNPDDTYWYTYMAGYLFYDFEVGFYDEANVSVSNQFELDFTAAPPTLTVLPLGNRWGYLFMNVDIDGDGTAEPGWGPNLGYDYFENNPTIAISPYWNGDESDRFPLGTEVRVDYMAEGASLFVNYTGVEPTKWLESKLYAGDFPSNPVGTEWGEILPDNTRGFVIEAWTDVDHNGKLSGTDTITIKNTATNVTRIATVSFVATGLSVIQKPVVCMGDMSDPFYGFYTVVDVAGFPHPERPMCPWHNKGFSVPLPSVLESATYTVRFMPPGRWIDLTLWGYASCNNTRYEYEDFAKGIGPNEPADAVQPQAKVILRAFVTYNLQPIAGKCVTFDIVSPTGEFHIIRSATTEGNWTSPLYGIAEILFTIPWPYPDPEGRVFGQWNVTATVDIVKVIVRDTLTFEVGYLIKDVFVLPGKQTYHKGDHMNFTLTYTSISHQVRTAYFTIVVYDELLVPIAWRIVGPINVTYGTHTLLFECMEIPHWVYRYRLTAYVNCLTDIPSTGALGTQYCPEIFCVFAVE